MKCLYRQIFIPNNRIQRLNIRPILWFQKSILRNSISNLPHIRLDDHTTSSFFIQLNQGKPIHTNYRIGLTQSVHELKDRDSKAGSRYIVRSRRSGWTYKWGCLEITNSFLVKKARLQMAATFPLNPSVSFLTKLRFKWER
jgi:hypothetical protein